MIRFKPLLVGTTILGFSLGAAATPMQFHTTFTPLNDSGVTGNAALTYDSSANTLKVDIHATGLMPDKVHPQHIHGLFANGAPADSTTPTSSNDANGDGVIELGEGGTTYGPILVPLTSPPGGALGDFPTAPGGTVNFSQVYDLSDSGIYAAGHDSGDLFPLNFREIVLHGMNVPFALTDGGTDYAAGEYDPVLPVASGEIVAGVAAVPEPGGLAMLLFGVLAIGGLAFARRRPGSGVAQRVG